MAKTDGIQLKKNNDHLWIGRELAAALGLDWDGIPCKGMLTIPRGTFPHEVFAIDVVGTEVFVLERLKPDGTPDQCVKYMMDVNPGVFDLSSWAPVRVPH